MASEREAVTGDHGLGNAAAMREALEKCRALAETIWQSKGGEDVSAEIAELKDLISTALAKPPRNCDRYSHDEALSVWAAEKENGKNGCFDEWLFAPATEQEGGAE